MNTIEQRIHQVLEEKRELFDTIFSGAEPHKHLGLTQSLEVGYELSPRGRAYLAARRLGRKSKSPNGRASEHRPW